MRANLLSDDTLRRVQELIARDGGEIAPQDQPTGRMRSRTPVLVRCTSATAAGASGVDAECYPGVIVDPKTSATSPQEELGTVWLTVLGSGGNDEPPTADAVYLCLLAGRRDIGGDKRPRAFGVPIGGGSGDGSSGFWAEITGSSGTPVAYSWKRKVMTGPGTWADATEPAPLTGTSNAYRAPSNDTPPDIPIGQVVELRPSLTSAGDYEIHAVGGIQTQTFNIWRYSCSSGSLVETEYTVTVKGRDLSVSVE